MRYLLIGGKFNGGYTAMEGTRIRLEVPSKIDWDKLTLPKPAASLGSLEVETYCKSFVLNESWHAPEKIYVSESFKGDLMAAYKKLKVAEAIYEVVNSKAMMNFIELLRYESGKQWDDSWTNDIKAWLGNTVRYNYLWVE